MLKIYAALPPRKRMGILAIILGIFAAFIGNPSDATKTTVNIKEIALMAEKDANEINVNDIADWVIKGKMDYRLIDLREESEFNEYNIPTSENIRVHSLLNSDLKRNEKIILYSEDDLLASQAWFILKATNYKSVYIVDDGMEAWKEDVVLPTCKCDTNPTNEQKELHAKREEVAKFFGGAMQADGGNDITVKKDLPKLKAPTKVTLKRTRTKKSREGC